MIDDTPEISTVQVYLIRHGETAWSCSGQHTSRTDLPLTPHGQDMARELATTLRRVAFSLVLCSPRRRARATCDMAGLGATVQIDANLAEWDYGDYEGLNTAEIHKLNPEWNLWEQGCPNGETPSEVGVRADQLISRLNRISGPIALFSHGHFGRVLAARWIGLPVLQGQHFDIEPASISILGCATGHPGRRVITLWNATASGGLRAIGAAPTQAAVPCRL